MKLIVGLGNPGKEYEMTWHNLGAMTLNEFAADAGFTPWSRQKNVRGLVASGTVGGEKIILLKPETFMNESGISVAAALKIKKIAIRDLVLVHDDLDFPLGTLRVAKNRSAAGHNGVKSVIDALGTKDFARLRLGIATRAAKKVEAEKFVLKKIPKADQEQVNRILEAAPEALDKILKLGLERATQEINSKGEV
jgi:PTH1 family peptidyl-tRNA hydrolase